MREISDDVGYCMPRTRQVLFVNGERKREVGVWFGVAGGCVTCPRLKVEHSLGLGAPPIVLL